LPELPADASAASKLRLAIATALAARCPPRLGREIALTGSASLGLADDASDVELNFWVDVVPSSSERFGWVDAVGATDVVPDEVVEGDGSVWLTFRFGGVTFEAGWQSMADVERVLTDLLSGTVIQSRQRVFASLVAHAVPIRTTGLLARWQERLADYPDTVQRAVIASNTEVWQVPHAVNGRWALCDRGDYLSLTERLLWDVYNILRIVFALNRQWDPDWKWLRPKMKNLTIAPERLADRVDVIFSSGSPRQRVAACQQLILDTLALAPATPGVSRAREVVASSLEQHALP
jgi:hypothetical protein